MRPSHLAGTLVIVATLAVGHAAAAASADEPKRASRETSGDKKQKDEKQRDKDLVVAQRARDEGRKLAKVVTALAPPTPLTPGAGVKSATPKEEVDRALMLAAENDLRATGDLVLLAVVLAHSKAVPGGVDDLDKTIEGVEAALRELEGVVGKLEAMSAQLHKILPAIIAEVGSDPGARTLCQKLESASEGAATVQAIFDRLDEHARSALLSALGIKP